jgi:hypothetical protein
MAIRSWGSVPSIEVFQIVFNLAAVLNASAE